MTVRLPCYYVRSCKAEAWNYPWTELRVNCGRHAERAFKCEKAGDARLKI